MPVNEQADRLVGIKQRWGYPESQHVGMPKRDDVLWLVDEVEALRAALATRPLPHNHDAQLAYLIDEWGHLGTVMQVLRTLTDDQAKQLLDAARARVEPAAGSPTPTPHECVAKGCDDDAITEFADRNGMILWLCEDHGDELAVGFPLKDAADQITCPRCGGAGFIHIYEAVAGSATPTGDDE